MKCNGSLDAVKMKTEPIKDDDGNVIAHESFWMVTLKIPAKRIDANDLRDMVDELLEINVETFQQSLDLKDVTKRAAAEFNKTAPKGVKAVAA